MSIVVSVNGVQRELHETVTVAGLVAEIGRGPAGIAVAVNSEVVSRSAWAQTVLAAGDSVEILTAAQGG